jgi:hypothetical protein
MLLWDVIDLDATYFDLLQAQTTKFVNNQGFQGGMEPGCTEEPLHVYRDRASVDQQTSEEKTTIEVSHRVLEQPATRTYRA